MAEFDERLWGAMVDCVTVGVDGGMTVMFRDGTAVVEYQREKNDAWQREGKIAYVVQVTMA